jgi:hypothetical protein
MKALLWTSVFLLAAQLLAAQGIPEQPRPDSRSQGQGYEPSPSHSYQGSKSTKKRQRRPTYSFTLDQLVAEQQMRMQANARQQKKMMREMEKPQYSDPSYLGHKKPPRKNPPGKKKFCRECGMWH